MRTERARPRIKIADGRNAHAVPRAVFAAALDHHLIAVAHGACIASGELGRMQTYVVHCARRMAWAARVHKAFKARMQPDHHAARDESKLEHLSKGEGALAAHLVTVEAGSNRRDERMFCAQS